MEKLLQKGRRDLVVIAEDVDGEALATMVLKSLRGTFNLLAVKAPVWRSPQGHAGRHRHLDGRHRHHRRRAANLETVTIDELGQQRKCKPTRTIPRSSKARAISSHQGPHRANQGRIENTTSDYDKEKLQRAPAKLSGGVAITPRGRGDRDRLKEKKHRVEDALSATRAAVEEGVVPGGGVALVNASAALNNVTSDEPTSRPALPSCAARSKAHAPHRGNPARMARSYSSTRCVASPRKRTTRILAITS